MKTPAGLRANVKERKRVTLPNPNDPLSLVSRIDSTSLNGQWTVSTYTASTRRAVTTSPLGRQAFATLDASGRVVVAQVAGLDSVRFSYDSRGRLFQEQVGGRIWTYDYDSRGRLLSTLDPLGLRDSLFYDDADRVSRRVLPGGREVQFGYDSSGNLTSLTPPGRPAHAFAYTTIDLDSVYTPPSAGAGNWATQYRYTIDRELRAIVRPAGDSIALAYESATGRLSTVTFDRGALSYGYNPTTGTLSSITAPGSNTLSFSYDGSLPTSVTWAGTVVGSVGVTYNNDFRVITQTVNGANSVSSGFDADGLLTMAGALGLKRHAQHGLVERDSVGNVLAVCGYDPKGDLGSYTASFSGNPLFQTGYTRDSLGRITLLTETVQGGTTIRAFTYDSAGRLSTVTENSVPVRTYGYDANGNRLGVIGPGLSITGSYDAQDRLLSYDGASYTYTTNGELQEKVVGTDTTRYTYDAMGNLTQVRLPDATVIGYVIDGQNRRVGKKVNGVLQRGWLWQSQLAPVAELDGAGALVSRFVYATRVNVPDYVIKAGATYRLVLDHLGSVRLVLNTADGTVAQRLDYDEFGRVTQNTNPGFQPFGFAGGLYDEQTGLVRFDARDYDPVSGRWTAKDPIGFAGSDGNLYAYVGNDPLDYADITGLDWHHYFPRSIFRSIPNLSQDAFRVFNNSVLGPLTQHGWSQAHRRYNEAVQRLWDRWSARLNPSRLTEADARRFIQEIQRSSSPAIRNFLRRLRAGGRAFGVVGNLLMIVDLENAAACEEATGVSRWAWLMHWWFGEPLVLGPPPRNRSPSRVLRCARWEAIRRAPLETSAGLKCWSC